jgi:delta24-sterol reductase
MTTHSHKVGLYQEAVVAYELVLSDGSLVRATAHNQHSDLYYSLPWSHGTLGFLVAVELKIIPVKPYIHMRYIPVTGQKRYCDMIRDLSGALDGQKETADYIECTVYSHDKAVIMVGDFADVKTVEDRKKINRVSRWYKPWFYKHVETFLAKGESEEFIPINDYLLRHNRAIFWVMESMVPFGNHPLFRWLFGWLCPAKPAFLKFTTTPGVRAMTFTKQVFQDIVLPMTVLEDSIDLAEELFDTFPLLIYPCRIYNHGEHKGQLRPPKDDQMTPNTNYGMFYDLGVYGTPGLVKRRQRYDACHAMRSMEKFIRDVGGYSFLYADIFMDEEEFGQMFDLTLYNNVRAKYGMTKAFPTLYDKVKPEVDVFAIGKRYAERL